MTRPNPKKPKEVKAWLHLELRRWRVVDCTGIFYSYKTARKMLAAWQPEYEAWKEGTRLILVPIIIKRK